MFNSPLNQHLTDTDLTSHYRTPPEPLLKTVEMIQSRLKLHTSSVLEQVDFRPPEGQTPLRPLDSMPCKFPEAQVKSWTLTQKKKNSHGGQWNTFSDKPIYETQQASLYFDNGSDSPVSLLALLNLDLKPIWTKTTWELRLNLDSFIGTVYLNSLCKHSDRKFQIETYLSTL